MAESWICVVDYYSRWPEVVKLTSTRQKGLYKPLESSEDTDDPYLALLSYRTTPLAWCNISPAELLMGRRNLPQLEEQLDPRWPDLEHFRNMDHDFKQKQKCNFDRRHRPSSNHLLLYQMTLRSGSGLILKRYQVESLLQQYLPGHTFWRPQTVGNFGGIVLI